MNSDDGHLIDTDTGGILRVAWPRAESWWPRPESNQRHTDFQSAALPTELLGRTGAPGVGVRKRSADYKRNSPARQEYPAVAAVAPLHRLEGERVQCVSNQKMAADRATMRCAERRAGARRPPPGAANNWGQLGVFWEPQNRCDVFSALLTSR